MARNAVRARGYVASLAGVVQLRPLNVSGGPQVGVASTISINRVRIGGVVTVTAGSLPAGMTLDSANRVITGTPTTAGVASFTLTETLAGANGSPKTSALSITVLPAANVDSAAAYTFVASDVNRVVPRSNASAQTITVPPNSQVPFPVDTILTVQQTGAGALTIVAGAGVTLNKLSTQTLVAAGQYAMIQLRQTAVDVWTVFGGLTAG